MKLVSLSLSLLAALAIGGCQAHHKDDDHADDAHEDTTEMGIEEAATPAPAREAFNRDHPGAKIMKIEKETYPDGRVHFDFQYTGADGTKGDAEYDASGKPAHGAGADKK